MPFIPHTPADVAKMLEKIGVDRIDALFDEIPAAIPRANLASFPAALNEAEIGRRMAERSVQAQPGTCFIGAGAYEHHIPAAVWQLTTRGEFYTAYTPYQAEASQGSLQVIYEYQTMMSSLMGHDVSNASLYDGSTALAEAILMAVRIKRSKCKRVIIPKTVHPLYRSVLRSVLSYQDITLEELDYCREEGRLTIEALQAVSQEGLAAVVIPQPNFFGNLELVDQLTDLAHEKGALVIAVVNPMAMALIKEPGQWGQSGADIACGEGQPLGVPLSSGGPYFGFLTCKKEFLRQLPGRIVGMTADKKGTPGFTLTLQAREQHIRRAKATSNICTNQGLVVTAATIYMSLLGPIGLREVALASHQQANNLLSKLQSIKGIDRVFSGPLFHEFVIRFDRPVSEILSQLQSVGIEGGYALTKDYPELGESLLVCVTETKTDNDLVRYQETLEKLC